MFSTRTKHVSCKLWSEEREARTGRESGRQFDRVLLLGGREVGRDEVGVPGRVAARSWRYPR